MGQAIRTVRRVLDATYLAGGIVAALCLVVILLLIVAQMVTRWIGVSFPGGADYAGYFMSAASFMAFAYALNHGAHIRVSLLLQVMGRWRRWGEVWCFSIGAIAATFLFRYAVKGVYWSWKLGDVSQGQDATPLWIPQTAMAVGAGILALCFWDNLVRVLFTGTSGVRADISEHSRAE